MRDTQLILIEGMPGAGKSTAANALVGRLTARGVRAVQLQEVPGSWGTSRGEAHPLHVGGELFPAGGTTGEALVARYTPERFIEESLHRWERFVRDVLAGDAVYVVESYPYQSTSRVLLGMDAGEAQIREHAARMELAMAPLRPVLIYFDRPDAAQALRATAEERGPEWAAYLIELVAGSPYSTRRGLTGLDAVDVMLGAYKALLDWLVASCRLPKLVLRECRGDWDECYRRIDAFLALDA
jgi:hypothetical protein